MEGLLLLLKKLIKLLFAQNNKKTPHYAWQSCVVLKHKICDITHFCGSHLHNYYIRVT